MNCLIGSNAITMRKVNVFQPTRILASTNVGDVQEWVKEHLEIGEKIFLIDLSHVFFMDSSGLGALLAIQKMIKAHGGEFALCGIQDQTRMLFDMTAMGPLFSTYADQSDFEHRLQVSSQ